MLPAIATTPAQCDREVHKTHLVYRWALAPVVADRAPALQVLWREDGEMTCAVIPHDPSMHPEAKPKRKTRA